MHRSVQSRIVRGVTGLIAGVLLSSGVQAAESRATAPADVVRNTTEAVIERIQSNQERLRDNPEAVADVVRDLVLPEFDFKLMSQLVLAQAWRDASDDQKARFQEQFKELLIGTYGNSLAKYSGQEIVYKPVHAADDATRVTVPVEVQPDDGPAVPIAYRLFQKDSGQWQVFDVSVDGVSLVQNYRGSFQSDIRRNGLDALIERLAKRNAGNQG